MRVGDDLRLVLAGEGAVLGAEAIAAEVQAAAREVLGHVWVIHARELSDSEGITRLHVLVFADLGEEVIRDGLAEALAATEALLLGRLGPIFESFRTGMARGAAIVPMLVMPHPPAHERGAAIATCLKRLLRRGLAPGPRRRLRGRGRWPTAVRVDRLGRAGGEQGGRGEEREREGAHGLSKHSPARTRNPSSRRSSS